MITTPDFIALQSNVSRAQKALTEAHAHRARWFNSEAHAAIRATRDDALAAIKAGSKGAPAARSAIEAEYQAAISAAAPAVPDGERAVLDADRALDRALAELKPVLDAVRDACAESVLRAGKVRVRIGHPRAEHHASTTWEKYSKAWHRSHGPATVHETELRVPAEWCERVQARGLAVCDGLLTLDAEPAEAPAGYEAFRACWVENGRGYDVAEKHGFIVRALGRDASTAHVDHGGTVAQGVALLRRRGKIAAPSF